MSIGIRSKFSSWIGSLRQKASDLHPRARIVGGIDRYHPVLDTEVGDEVNCWRLPGECDDHYALRLGAHITRSMNEHEALLAKVLNFRNG